MSWFSALGTGAGASTVGSGAIAAGGGGSLAAGGAAGATGMGVLAPQAAGPVASISGVSPASTSIGSAIPMGGGGGGGGLPGMPQMPSIGAIFEGVTQIAQGITAKKQADAEAKLAKSLANENANRVYSQLIRIAGKGRAIEGAQGTTGTGSGYLTYLENVGQAQLGAATARFEGQSRAKALKRQGELAMRAGILRGGTSLLTGRG